MVDPKYKDPAMTGTSSSRKAKKTKKEKNKIERTRKRKAKPKPQNKTRNKGTKIKQKVTSQAKDTTWHPSLYTRVNVRWNDGKHYTGVVDGFAEDGTVVIFFHQFTKNNT